MLFTPNSMIIRVILALEIIMLLKCCKFVKSQKQNLKQLIMFDIGAKVG